MERFEHTPTWSWRLRPFDFEIFGFVKVTATRHRTGVSCDIAREQNQPKRVVVAWKKCEICVYLKIRNCVSLVKTSKKIENFQKSEKSENLVSRSVFCGICPAWLAKIKKSWKHSSRLTSFAKVGEIQFFSLSIRPLRTAFSRMFINEKTKFKAILL